MPSNREVRVRVTRNQLERIKLNAHAKGFKTVSGYIRHLCLEHNDHIESKILETHKIVKEFINVNKRKV